MLRLIPCSDGITPISYRAAAILFDGRGEESGTVQLSDRQPCERFAEVDVSGLPRECTVRWELREAGSDEIAFTLNCYLPYYGE